MLVLEKSAESYFKHTGRVNEVEYLISEVDGRQIVAFRGTEVDKFLSGGGWVDLIRDLRAFPWFDRRVGWSHAGFLKGARLVVERQLQYKLDRTKPVTLTGHSLGGALAMNAAALLKSKGFIVTDVTTFGAPRTFMRGTARNFRIPTTNYSNPGDPVPDMPFRWWGYRHVNEVPTIRPARGYSILTNHLVSCYQEAFKDAEL